MWSQVNIAAVWTKQALFDALVALIEDPGTGFVSYDTAETAQFRRVWRSNLGTGKDVCLRLALTDISGGTRIQFHMFETADYSTSTHSIPANNRNLGYNDFLFANNLLVNLAVPPSKEVVALWYKQGSTVTSPWIFATIDPFKKGNGSLVNSADDGTGYPLWGAFMTFQGSSFASLESSHTYTVTTDGIAYINTGTYFGPRFAATRSPLSKGYYVRTMEAASFGTTYGGQPTARFPHSRVTAWAGSGSLGEGFRPAIWSANVNSGQLQVDNRGLLGQEGDILIADSFGGAVEDYFSVDGKDYRIVCVNTDANSNTLHISGNYYSIAVRV